MIHLILDIYFMGGVPWFIINMALLARDGSPRDDISGLVSHAIISTVVWPITLVLIPYYFIIALYD